MSLQSLDRTQWSYAEALAHVETVTVARRTAEAAKAPPKPEPAYQHWNRPQDPTIAWKAEAENELLVALRDGDLIAQGRYTEDRPNGWGYGASSGFDLHSGYHTSIRPEQWREGQCHLGRLTARDWEFIDIRMPRFLVKAIWPDYVPEVRPAAGTEAVPYTTPYLDLMQAAIAKFGITAKDQGKKDCLVDWFLEQEIEGEPVSNKLADAMATLIRLPSAQRGGAKRVLGPDLRQTG
ncbi:hypothetical protein DLJ49_19210 [Rhodovulum sp. 12E13]|uniref:hypothetical protein n=1 Tax=Rhodovulum sp. 12E13 TaxID=2203891 RepID=UPI000E121A61|nr:hypothetical protein [Rhodovulum sp. 12E13]RDC68964.1 hypothetical protein DLJ49_19210 [Rhodovulum sp. 12E13]